VTALNATVPNNAKYSLMCVCCWQCGCVCVGGRL
jgi:hypothetical protein